MSRKKRLKLCLASILLLLAVLIGYKIYLLVHETDYQALNADHISRIENLLRAKTEFSFAVVGNIRNSMRIFQRRIAPLIKKSKADFMVSAGNAVADGAEDKYRLLYRGLKKLEIPYVAAAGRNEIEDFGAEKFYRHFGPYFFSFHLQDAYFIFLDSTGQTSWKWQMRWLRQELVEAGKYPYRFVFLADSLFPFPGFEPEGEQHVLAGDVRVRLRQLFTRYRVTMVFSAGFPAYRETVAGGVRYIVSGGGGGLLLDPQEQYQFVAVHVGPEGVTSRNIAVPHRPGRLREKIETLKLFLHSFFYMSLFNSLLVIGVIGLLGLKIYSLIIKQEHLYRDFSVDEDALADVLPRVAMFTNNYLPFIGGVPLSVKRLSAELSRAGAAVKIFAPVYPQQGPDPEDGSVFRCPALFYTRKDRFPVANLFSPKTAAALKAFDPDLVHIHQPFWLGKKGMRLGRKLGKPVIFTYHTRLEHYTHYIPLPGGVLKNLIVHFVIKRFANRCDAIVTPTHSTEEYLRNLGVSTLIETIPTGINTEAYRRWSDDRVRELRARYAAPDERLLISVSRMAKEKNLDFLVDGLAKAAERSRAPFRCLLVGEGPETGRLEEKAAALGIGDRIVFTGAMPPDEVVGCYLAADLFVFASTSETQGMVLLEAMAGGCPVVAVRASGVHDVVKDGYNGFKVAESTDSWAEAVARLAQDDRMRTELAENGRRFAAGYSVQNMAERVLRLYRRTVVLGRSKND